MQTIQRLLACLVFFATLVGAVAAQNCKKWKSWGSSGIPKSANCRRNIGPSDGLIVTGLTGTTAKHAKLSADLNSVDIKEIATKD